MHEINTIGMVFYCKEYQTDKDFLILDSYFIEAKTESKHVLFYNDDGESKIFRSCKNLEIKYGEEIIERLKIPIGNVATVKDNIQRDTKWLKLDEDEAYKKLHVEFKKLNEESSKSINQSVDKLIEFINKYRAQNRNKLEKFSKNEKTWLIMNPLKSDVRIKLKKFIMEHKPNIIDAKIFNYWKDEFKEGCETRGIRGVDFTAYKVKEQIQGVGDIDTNWNGDIGPMGETGIQSYTGIQGITGCMDRGVQGVTGTNNLEELWKNEERSFGNDDFDCNTYSRSLGFKDKIPKKMLSMKEMEKLVKRNRPKPRAGYGF